MYGSHVESEEFSARSAGRHISTYPYRLVRLDEKRTIKCYVLVEEKIDEMGVVFRTFAWKIS